MYGMGAGWLPAMISGASVCLIDKNNIVKLYDKIAQFHPDVTLITPAVSKMLLLLNKDISAKTIYITAGEIMKQEVYEQFESRYGTLINLYGCTELGAIATTSLEDNDRDYSSAGLLKPLDHVAVEIDGEEKGEILCMHNAGFEGYVDKYGNMQPGQEGKSTWYRTKDLGWHNSGPYFKVIGRKDNCINRAGFLISLEEVEHKLEDLFSMKKAVVFECDKEEGLMNRLVAVCELADGMDPDDKAVKDICRNKMSRHQVPDEFYFVRNLPRLNNGKPDRIFIIHNYKTFIKN
jgi:acyl-coenzyme A synthetase/AMP-(fatty) acid ligase